MDVMNQSTLAQLREILRGLIIDEMKKMEKSLKKLDEISKSITQATEVLASLKTVLQTDFDEKRFVVLCLKI